MPRAVWGGVSGRTISEEGESLPFVSVALLNPSDSTILDTAVSDTLGYFTLTPKVGIPRSFILKASYIGYYPYVGTFTHRDVGTIALRRNDTILHELVVRPEEREDFASHSSYRLDPTKSRDYNTLLEALDLIPSLRVSGWRTLTGADGGAVLTLLNGAQIDQKELLVIDKSDVDKVEVYRNPPARFAAMGVGMVVNIITKKHLRGGDLALDTDNALTMGNGTNILSLGYNYNDWRLSLGYDNNYIEGKYRRDEKIRYDLGGVEYSKEKSGLDYPLRRQQHNLQLRTSKSWDSDLLLSTTILGKSYRNSEEIPQEVTGTGYPTPHSALTRSTYSWRSLAGDLYLSKRLHKHHELLLDLTGSVYDSRMLSGFRETIPAEEQVLVDQTSTVRGLKKSLTAELQYGYSGDRLGYHFGVRDRLSGSDQRLSQSDEVRSTSQLNTLHLFGDLSGSIRIWRLYGSLSLQRTHFKSPELDQSFTFTSINPDLRVYCYPTKGMTLFGYYRIANIVPDISMLTETPILRDVHYAFVGNSKLHPYLKHNIITGAQYGHKYFSLLLNLIYSTAKGAILPYFEERQDYIAETYSNMPLEQNFLTAWQVRIMPLGDHRLTLMSYGNFNKGFIQGPHQRWRNDYLRYFFEINLHTKRWDAKAFYQSSGNFMRGQWLTRAPQATVLELTYKSPIGLTVGVGGRYLFVKEYKDGLMTHPEALMQVDRWSISQQTANTVYLRLTYSFSFGKSEKGTRQKLSNIDTDSGLLTE